MFAFTTVFRYYRNFRSYCLCIRLQEAYHLAYSRMFCIWHLILYNSHVRLDNLFKILYEFELLLIMYEIAKSVSSCICYNVVTRLLKHHLHIDGILCYVTCVIVSDVLHVLYRFDLVLYVRM